MNRAEATQLLRLVCNTWPTLKVTEDLISAWHLVLEDVPASECITALRGAIRAGLLQSDFAPTPIKIREILRSAKAPNEEAAIVFELGPANAKSTRAKQTWRVWGGQDTYGMLPDVRYSDNPERALTTLRFEKMRFVEIYNSLEKTEKREVFQIACKELKQLVNETSKALPGV